MYVIVRHLIIIRHNTHYEIINNIDIELIHKFNTDLIQQSNPGGSSYHY